MKIISNQFHIYMPIMVMSFFFSYVYNITDYLVKFIKISYKRNKQFRSLNCAVKKLDYRSDIIKLK